MRVLWTRLAVKDLDQARAYVAEHSPDRAAPMGELIERTAAMLARHPLLGRAGRVESTRELVVSHSPFILAYRLKPGRVEIVALIHAARRWPEDF